MKLTPAILASQSEGPLPDLIFANCANMGISHIDDISVAVNLHKLDLSHNAIKKADALSGIHHNNELTLLKLKGNKLESLEGVEYLKKLIGMCVVLGSLQDFLEARGVVLFTITDGRVAIFDCSARYEPQRDKQNIPPCIHIN